MVAEGKADVYPRYAPTMEWDTAAGHAIANMAGFKVLKYRSNEEIKYNKKSLLNPWFLVTKNQLMISNSINKAQDRIKRNFDDKDFLELFKKGGVAMLFRIGGQLMGFLLTFVIAYFFGANGLGDYVLAIVVLKIFTLVSKLGLDTVSIKYIASYCARG